MNGPVTTFRTPRGTLRAVNGLALKVPAGKTVCIAGESGCGKSVTALSIMGLLSDNARIETRQIHFHGQDLVQVDAGARPRLRGRELAMIFQEPMTALNPVLSVGWPSRPDDTGAAGNQRPAPARRGRRHKQALLARLSDAFRNERWQRVGSLELDGGSAGNVQCDLVFDAGWRGALAQRFFAPRSPVNSSHR